ncbi:MAG: CHAT domain-containing protein [Leptolyngbyaceae cyanobacterium SM1_4_3]|nr:CHAT domain-containing protein [Leptolyngbyaceae cyanobacterium SM1_4_3]
MQNSFIQFWGNRRITLEEISQLQLNTPATDLLVLSACETALGDRAAELGFAGAAAKAEVKSVLASLWQVDDRATLAFMAEFYSQLRDVPIKAEAVRRAQVAMQTVR